MLLDIKELHTFYGASHALQGISLSVEEGQIVSLLGRNGMGKSTTLKSVMGLTKPRSGAILFKGKQIFGPAAVQGRYGGYRVRAGREANFSDTVGHGQFAPGSRREERSIREIRIPGRWTGFFNIFLP